MRSKNLDSPLEITSKLFLKWPSLVTPRAKRFFGFRHGFVSPAFFQSYIRSRALDFVSGLPLKCTLTEAVDVTPFRNANLASWQSRTLANKTAYYSSNYARNARQMFLIHLIFVESSCFRLLSVIPIGLFGVVNLILLYYLQFHCQF